MASRSCCATGSPRRPECLKIKLARRRPRMGLGPSSSPSARSPIEEKRRLAHRRFQLHRPRPVVRQRHPRPAPRRPPADLRHAALRRAAVPVRPGGQPDRRPSVSARKPLFMDESAHDWRLVRLGRTLGWTGVALKTCKTQTGRAAEPLLGEGPRHDADGPGPDEPDARAGPPRPARRPCRHDHGRRDQRHAVLPGGLATRGRRPPGPLPADATGAWT